MASIYKRKNENGTTVWRAVIRIKGYPSISNHFERKQEADDWVQETERRIKLGQFNFSAHNKHHTYTAGGASGKKRGAPKVRATWSGTNGLGLGRGLVHEKATP